VSKGWTINASYCVRITANDGVAVGRDDKEQTEKITITLNDGKARQIQHISSAMYWSPDGKPITAKEFIERLFDDLPQFLTTKIS
jgi:type I restriction enzyme R subunit